MKSTETPSNSAVRAAIRTLQAYQGATSGRISPCRFYPSCSNYAIDAFTEHGFWQGFALTAKRLVRCRPFGPHGVDLVPLHVHARSGSKNGSGRC
jgi:putative membrane protein insertion efficiency factor